MTPDAQPPAPQAVAQEFTTLQLQRDARGVVTLALNRVARHNAMDAVMIAELHRAALELGADPRVRVVVLTGLGASFCAGGDLGWMRDQIGADAETRAAAARALAQMLQALNEMPKPLIGRVQGNAFGGGLGLIAVCDVAIGLETVTMGLTETRLGLIPATIGPYVLARMGEAMARRVFLSARLFQGPEAVSLGLLARVLPDAAALDAAIAAEVAPYLACAPGAVAAAKALARSLGPPIGPAQIEASIAALVARWESPESAEGIAAFFDKRKPGWAEDSGA